MKHHIPKILTIFIAVFALNACLPSANAAPIVGEVAPDFTAIDTNGITHKLSDFKGKNVVLEWSNHDCPFVVKHYSSSNMQKLQKEVTDTGALWLTIVSSAKGKQGYVSPIKANDITKDANAHPTAKILDPSGEIGRLYDAKTTPHMFIIDKNGILAYAGAIDSNSSFNPASIPNAINYVRDAINALNSGEKVQISSTKPYGCSIKY